ncbi:alpha/beta hydrolase [Patescibacteria group bacterium]|nr:alpha/beta hydrolase [Patescibacteria group bacterium]
MKDHYFIERGIVYRTNDLVPGRPTLVFVHGVSGSSSAWKAYEEALKDEINIVTYDQRGHGNSKRYPNYSDHHLKHFVEDLHLLLTHIGEYPYVLVGHSFGALVVLAYLAQWQHTLKGAVLISGDYSVGRHVPTKILRWLLTPIPVLSYLPLSLRQHGRVDYERFPDSGDWNVSRSYTDICNTGFRTYLYCIRQSYELDATDTLSQLQLPTLLIHGTKDTIFGIENSVAMKEKIPGARLETIEGGNHIMVLNAPQNIIDILRTFVKTTV